MKYGYRIAKSNKTKKIALIAHDNRKQELIAWVKKHKTLLQPHELVGTGTTAKLLEKHTSLSVEGYKSGPLGGDQQVGAAIAEEEIDMLIFFWDPLEAQPHDPDVKALLRIAALYDIPVAPNKATADFILSSRLFNEVFERKIVTKERS
ncbi:methylglyoxal synthase [Isachenkonia alkalipeptolytica]|uniref:Methylglyoxal synthase n=1 Tax=Isachenkonia alkalipeptolytica TaxID=2565777 RepID=A0AA44BC32_9CLOT|nr:methylglyoxal synthase [Isachenkonia alkalipeptolytica]